MSISTRITPRASSSLSMQSKGWIIHPNAKSSLIWNSALYDYSSIPPWLKANKTTAEVMKSGSNLVFTMSVWEERPTAFRPCAGWPSSGSISSARSARRNFQHMFIDALARGHLLRVLPETHLCGAGLGPQKPTLNRPVDIPNQELRLQAVNGST